ncbi:MAG: EAL domain-containing protein, partial [Methylococcales bacterium]
REWRLILDNKIVLEQQNRLLAILEATPDLICIADTDGFLTYLNKAGHELLAIPTDENLNKIRLSDFHKTSDAILIMEEAIPYAIKHGMWTGETTFISNSGEIILTSQVLVSHKSSQGEIDFFSTVAKDIRSLRSAEETIKYLAYYDTLTGLANRNELLKRLDYEIDRVQRNNNHSALLYIDLDNFKYVNDSLGHPTGDLVLKEIAQRLQAEIRGEDTLARLGGDEFVVILTGLSLDSIEALNQARNVTKKLNKLIAKDILLENMTFNLTASIGISMFSAGTDNSHELLRFADTAMYEAKKSGKNQFEVFHQDMSIQVHRQLELERKLRVAYSNNEFILYFQPKNKALTGTIHGAEVLLRWNEPENGIRAPGYFLDILESSGLIIDVGNWVLEESLKQLASWIKAGLWKLQQRLSINISTRQFQDEHFSKSFINLLDKINVPAQCIDLEITEYSLINDVKKSVVKMQELISKGITFSLDDFGTGYSSLSYLKNLPVSTVKIDRSFIKDITEDKSDEALVISIITICKNLGLSVVAEGVETKEQLKILNLYQCEYVQGYYFSKPVPAIEFEALLAQ